jgi:hypothetical protein
MTIQDVHRGAAFNSFSDRFRLEAHGGSTVF